MTAAEMQTMAYVISTASDAVLYKVGQAADDHAAAASVIVHNMTNSAPASYNPEWPLLSFDQNRDPLGTGQITTGVRGVYDSLLGGAAQYGGPWQIVWDTAPDTAQIGDVVTLSGVLSTVAGTNVPNRELRLQAEGAALDIGVATTDADGRFSVTVTLQEDLTSVTASTTSPATTVMMREPLGWTTGERPQNMILVDNTQLQATITVDTTDRLVPQLGTSVRDQADGDRIIPADGGIVIDTVSYSNLEPGSEYTLHGELFDKQTGTATGLKGTTVFTPAGAEGTTEVEFTIPVGFSGSTLVVFEYLYNAEGNVVAEHADLEDEAQTVTVEAYVPAIGTSARDQSDGDRLLSPEGGVVIDTVTYSGLTPGSEYSLDGVMVDKATGKKTKIVGAKKFTAATSSGSVEVKFTVPAGHGGKTFVVFEYLHDADGELVAEHTDINDEAQTITVRKPTAPTPSPEPHTPPLAATGSDGPPPWSGLAYATVMLFVGTAALVIAKGKSIRQ
ncbi:VaFE repeat-containing surface-anchored protein [Leucobacter komagatae]|uniref:VaFE repeat-containing surface-anchored protein n=1 Tax=Leucobacter komagatae TaxID=55969 RepID=UPI000695E268|nr:VaFE repeat-containing surface-anchored protein [Leucobacter komagatae]